MVAIPSNPVDIPGKGLRQTAFWLLWAVLAWAPFPLGSNRPWSWCLLSCLVCVVWIVWWAGTYSRPLVFWTILARFKLPIFLVLCCIAWAAMQTLPLMPHAWIHPIWQLAEAALKRPLSGSISINAWRTAGEAMKLGTYVLIAALSLAMCQRGDRARKLATVLIAIGSFYALYTIALGVVHFTQFQLFYGLNTRTILLSGPFVSHNSLATFLGLSTLVTATQMFQVAHSRITMSRGRRIFLISFVNFLAGKGGVLIAAFILNSGALVACASRAGFVATLAGLGTMGLFAVLSMRRVLSRTSMLLAAAAILCLLVVVVSISGNTLADRISTLAETGTDTMRTALRVLGLRMIHDSPYLGLGLGTFENAYPLYADHVLPYVVDKMHSDYLEFAAGIGLPAAIAWWTAMLLIIGRCVHGVFARQRDVSLPLTAIGASALVGFHAIFDFSLQIPAISAFYAAILGMGAAQSFRQKEKSQLFIPMDGADQADAGAARPMLS